MHSAVIPEKKLLITGFDPFGGESVNPAWEAVRRLPAQVGAFSIHPLQVPTVFSQAARTALDAMKTLQPQAVLCVGQAGGRKAVTPEMVAINLRSAAIADNAGNQPQDEPVIPGAPAAYFATVPVRRMAQAIMQAGLPGTVSYSAGTFVCNDLMYTLLHHTAGTDISVGFIHVPFLPEQAGEGMPSLPLDSIEAALIAAIGALSD